MEKENAEIIKLTERIAKDPKSKLFVPLAEEHKKAGDIETAIGVLMEGLKHNPGYVTARSFLGRLLMDKGDLAGAQKELEEVIKTVPDNLLAQRKLGDIYVLLGRGTDALQRYKAALALNPADKDIPSLLADLEAGKDVSSRIPRPKTPVPPAAIKPQPAPTAAVQPKAAPSAVAPKTAAIAPQAAKAAQNAPAASLPQAAMKGEQAPVVPVPPASAAAAVTPEPTAPPARPVSAAPPAPPIPAVPDEAEVIEEIVELESLERAVPGPGPSATAPEGFPAPAPFDLSEPPIEMVSGGEEKEAMTWEVEEAAAPEQPVQAGPDEGSDDLNTNTLAELYISQGFYDKAIEVYQGMLNDRPGNTALLQKLEQIRDMAGAADKGREQFTDVTPGTGEYTPPAAEAMPAAPPQPMPAPDTAPPAIKESPQKETVLQERAPQMTVKEPSGESAAPRGPQAATTRRKETIDRLESWLNTIMKEKQE